MQLEFEQNRWAGWPSYILRGSALLMFFLGILFVFKSHEAPPGAVTWILLLLGLFLLAASLPPLAMRVFVTARSEPDCIEYHYALFTRSFTLFTARANLTGAKELVVESRYVSKFGTTYQVKTLAVFKGKNRYVCLDTFSKREDANARCAELAYKLNWTDLSRD